VKLPDPKFSSQTKDKLVSFRSAPAAGKPDGGQDGEWLEENPGVAKPIIQKMIDAAAAREAARKARELTRARA
jgi:DNA gyrase subunit B